MGSNNRMLLLVVHWVSRNRFLCCSAYRGAHCSNCLHRCRFGFLVAYMSAVWAEIDTIITRWRMCGDDCQVIWKHPMYFVLLMYTFWKKLTSLCMRWCVGRHFFLCWWLTWQRQSFGISSLRLVNVCRWRLNNSSNSCPCKTAITVNFTCKWFYPRKKN